MMEQFPLTLLPPAIRRTKTELPPIPPFQGTPPVMPRANVQQLNIPLLVGLFLLVLLVSLAILQSNTILGLLILTIGVFAVGFQAWVQGQSYPRRLKSNALNLEHYYEALEAYSRREADYQSIVRQNHSSDNVRAYQYPRLLQVLSRTVPEDGQQEFFKLNPAETQFLHRLNHYFPDKVFPRIFFSPGGTSPYVMDFAYIDPAINLRVDIEVDEPFNTQDFTPTHFIRDVQDQAWNDFMMSKGWSVIRFSADQIQQFPDSCCKALASLIFSVLEDGAIVHPFKTVADLESQARWTEAEARQMATQRSSLSRF